MSEEQKSTEPQFAMAGRIIRVIGGPVVDNYPEADFQQVPFTLQGLSEIVDLEIADTIVYWPDKKLFDRANIAAQLIEASEAFSNPKSNKVGVYGLPIRSSVILENTVYTSWFQLSDILPDGGPVEVIERIPAKAATGEDQTGNDRYIEVRSNKVIPKTQSPAFNGLATVLTEHLNYVVQHRKNLGTGKWVAYEATTGLASPTHFIRLVLNHVMQRCYAAAKRGAAIALVVPDDFAYVKGARRPNELMGLAYSWISPGLVAYRLIGQRSRTIAMKVGDKKTVYEEVVLNWMKKIPAGKTAFKLHRVTADSTVLVTEGVFHARDFSPVRFEGPLKIEPGTITADGRALSLVMRHGDGGFLLSSQPSTIRAFWIEKTDTANIVKILCNGEKVPASGKKPTQVKVRVRYDDGSDVPVLLTELWHDRFITFCKAALAAKAKRRDHAPVDVSKFAGRSHMIAQSKKTVITETVQNPWKAVQAINDTFRKALPSLQVNPIQKLSGSKRGASDYQLNPELWSLLDLSLLRSKR